MLHVISSTSTNITYKLAFYFLQSARQVDLTWILKTLLEQSTIIYSGVIITDADLSLMNAIGVVFPKPTTSFDLAHSKQYQSPPPKRFPFNRDRRGHPMDVSCVFKDVVAFSLGYKTSRSI